jgi:hypothetical protein
MEIEIMDTPKPGFTVPHYLLQLQMAEARKRFTEFMHPTSRQMHYVDKHWVMAFVGQSSGPEGGRRPRLLRRNKPFGACSVVELSLSELRPIV